MVSKRSITAVTIPSNEVDIRAYPPLVSSVSRVKSLAWLNAKVYPIT